MYEILKQNKVHKSKGQQGLLSFTLLLVLISPLCFHIRHFSLELKQRLHPKTYDLRHLLESQSRVNPSTTGSGSLRLQFIKFEI